MANRIADAAVSRRLIEHALFQPLQQHDLTLVLDQESQPDMIAGHPNDLGTEPAQ